MRKITMNQEITEIYIRRKIKYYLYTTVEVRSFSYTHSKTIFIPHTTLMISQRFSISSGNDVMYKSITYKSISYL